MDLSFDEHVGMRLTPGRSAGLFPGARPGVADTGIDCAGDGYNAEAARL